MIIHFKASKVQKSLQFLRFLLINYFHLVERCKLCVELGVHDMVSLQDQVNSWIEGKLIQANVP